MAHAALAQLGERQTEDLKVPGSIPGGGTCFFLQKRGQGGIEPPTSPTLRENHATRPLAQQMWTGKKGTTGIEPVTAGSAIPCSTAELSTHLRLGAKGPGWSGSIPARALLTLHAPFAKK